MIHNTCLNSSYVSFTCTSSYFETNPLLISSSINNCCCCCCCCANNHNNSTNLIFNSLPRINPSFLNNGLRQSTLIQFSPSKRFSYYGKRVSSISDLGRNYYYEKLYCFKDRKKLGKGRYSGSGYEDKRNKQFFGNQIDDEVESLLDLLTEEVGAKFFGVRDRKRVEKNVHLGSVKRENKGVEIRCREEEEEDRRKVVKKANCELKKEGSSCSSYYSVSSTGEYDEIKRDDGFVKGESSSENKNDLKTDSYRRYDEKLEENVDIRQEIGKESEIVQKNRAETFYGNEEWRKKSEKKLNIESGQLSERNSQHSERNDGIIESSSSSQKRYSGTIDNSLITAEYKGESSNRIAREDEYRRRSNEILEASQIHEDRREEKHQRIDDLTAKNESRVKSQQFSEISDTNITSSSVEGRMENREDNSVEVSGQVEDRREEKTQRIDLLTALNNSAVKSQRFSDISDTRITDNENVSVSRRQSDMRRKKEDTVTMDQRADLGRKNVEDTYSSSSAVKSQRFSDISDTRITDNENVSVSRRQSDLIRKKEDTVTMDQRADLRRKNVEETYSSSSAVKSQRFSDISDTRITDNENVSVSRRQSDLIRKKEDTVTMDQRADLRRKNVEETYSSSSAVKSQRFSDISDTRIADNENVSVSRRQSDMRSKKEDTVTMDQSADLRRKNIEETYSSSSRVEKVEGVTESMKTGWKTTKASSFNVGMAKEASSSYKALKLIPEPKLQKPGARGSDQTGSLPLGTTSLAGELQEQPQDSSYEDAIVSADQQQKSSSHFVGEFVKKAKHELSISEIQQEKEPDDVKLSYEEKSSGEDGSGNSDQKEGPSDEMWNETGAASQQPSETTDATDLTGNGELVKKSSRSLWNVIGDAVRLRWASPRSEIVTPKSSGGKMLSVQSTGSETWFSGHEPEDSNDEILKTGSTKSRSPSVIEESSFPFPAIRMRRSPVVKKTDTSTSSEMDRLVPKPFTGSTSGKMVILDQPVSVRVTETGLKDLKDREIKQRKLARIDQVSKDRFDEWEEAYTVEADQRKTDEFFMREALLEAKKAADFWEVPVGSVLVQDGRIIARGYNLVEELRDSTAHAEMICIREASNNLRSWRLSGTTLYVTLEPCPMCAGAILQARIDTVVWGAPNKLLGADGSWIRLFPDGDGANGSDKPPAPVHPFHPNMVVRRGVLSAECADVMQQFFQLRRKKKEKRTEDEQPTPSPPSCLPIAHHHNSKFFSKMHDAFSIMFCL